MRKKEEKETNKEKEKRKKNLFKKTMEITCKKPECQCSQRRSSSPFRSTLN
jgi:hypothetical protein